VDLPTLVAHALAEDIGTGDITTESTVDAGTRGKATITAKQRLVVAGHEPAAETFRQLGATYSAMVATGEEVEPGTVLADVEGPARALLTGERTALNFLMHLSGIATHVRAVVREACGMRVVDTRKTTPLLRAVEKAAVLAGGGGNHRAGLYDAVLIKDNHVVAAGGIGPAIARARAAAAARSVECEVESLDELRQALAAGADIILLDNMDDAMLREAAAINAGRAILEASGNMTAARAAGLVGVVDYVSMGGLVHQARWVDVAMRIEAGR
jgi:nicotinate-nucleotide pyrophosphorylase (carboxylating)